MEKGLLRAVILIAVVLLFSSCSKGNVSFLVLRGNYTFQQGRFQESTLHYLSAQELDGEFGPWISYNLGNVYHALGEVEAAGELWDDAERAENSELLFRLNFNRGILAYELGKYREAYEHFRDALKIDSSSIDAKVNLELSLEKFQALTRAVNAGRKEVEASSQGEKNDSSRILEYVRRKEGLRWNSVRNDTEEPDPKDW